MPKKGNGKPARGLEGRRIALVRKMTPELVASEGWHNEPPLVVLDDATLLYPSRDMEGNDGGALFGEAPAEWVQPGETGSFFVFGGEESMFLRDASIQAVRPMTPEEMEHQGWSGERFPPPILVLSNGVRLFPSRDEEGNGPGALYGRTPRGRPFVLMSDGEMRRR